MELGEERLALGVVRHERGEGLRRGPLVPRRHQAVSGHGRQRRRCIRGRIGRRARRRLPLRGGLERGAGTLETLGGRIAARHRGLKDKFGVKGKSGVLASKLTRAAFLCQPEHHVTFHFTPKHASWLNQIEIWFSILVRKLLRRGNFASKKALRTKIEQFIAYFNRTMAKPFRWTMEAKPLTG